MGKFDFKKVCGSIRSSAARYAPEILTGFGLAGMGVTAVLTAKGTIKAVKLLEEEKAHCHEPMKKTDVVKVTWKCYIPATVTAIASMACVIGANSVNAKRNAALAAAYNISAAALSEYKEKVIETIGEKKEQNIRESIAKDKIENNPVTSNEVIVTDKGNTLCYDSVFGRYFRSDRDAINRAINNINRTIVSQMYVSLNDFYSEIGLKPVDMGDDLGWNIDDRQIEAEFSSQLADDGTPCLVIGYNVAPKYGYSKLF